MKQELLDELTPIVNFYIGLTGVKFKEFKKSSPAIQQAILVNVMMNAEVNHEKATLKELEEGLEFARQAEAEKEKRKSEREKQSSNQ
jgi:hypothetical protein